MNFQEAEHQFRVLEHRWQAGQVDPRAYQEALVKLRVVDRYGETWMMQEHTGRWFVFRGGNWVLMSPPEPAPSPRMPAPQRATPVSPKPPSARGGRGLKLLMILSLLGMCVVCAGLSVYAYTQVANGNLTLPQDISNYLPDGSSSPVEGDPAVVEKAPEVEAQQLESILAAPNGTAVADSRGVELVVPADAVEEGVQVELSANDLDAPWRKDLETAVSLETPFYRLAAQGKSDSNGTLSLSFPAASPNSRLLAVVDDGYMVELAQVPQDGKLIVQARAAPADLSEMTLPEGVDSTGSIYYAVITPKSGSGFSGGVQMAAWNPSAAMLDDDRNCIPDISVIGGAAINLCRQNESGTVQVMLPTRQRELLPQVDMMVDKVEAAMTRYAELGFTTAKLSKSSPMLVRVSTTASSPSYYPLNGVLYIPVDTVKNFANQTPTEVYHEMAHWIQAVKYSTKLAYWSEERTWWLETSAENMVMLLDPDYLGKNLLTYGTISNESNTLAFQSSPYQWPGDYYVHAQILKLNMCDSSTCPLSQASFAKAISEGTYPLMNGTAKSLIGQNLQDYAYYLLGKFPVRANTAISLSGPVKTGEGYGEYVRVKRTDKMELAYEVNGYAPQMSKENKDGKETVLVEAPIQKDAVYPLMILGGSGDKPGLPVQLVIEPGASFYYTVDDGELKYSDGSAELKLLPIHGGMGYKKVRIVAMGINGGEVFKARVEPLSIEGAWTVTMAGAKTGGGITCQGGDDDNDNPDGSGMLMAIVTYVVAGTGDMTADPTGQSLDWNQVASRVPPSFQEEGITFQATALVAGDGIKYQARLHIPRNESESSLPIGAPLASLALLPLAWVWSRRMSLRWVRIVTNVLVIAFMVLVSAGCINIYGDSTLDAKFTKLEYVGGEDTGVINLSGETESYVPEGKPLWKLTGSGTYNVNVNYETATMDENGNETGTKTETCSGQITFPVTAYIFKDMVVNISSE